MTPWTQRRGGKPVGSLMLEWERSEIGCRIRKATGWVRTPLNVAKVATLRDILDRLYNRDRIDIITAVRDGVIAPAELYRASLEGRLTRLKTAEHLAGAAAHLEKWVKETEHPDTKKGRAQAVQNLLAIEPGVTLGELPALLLRYAETATPGMANRVRDNVQAFFRDFLTKEHPLYLEVRNLERYETKAVYQRNHLSPAQLRALPERMAEAPREHAAFRAMCLTGMGPREYFSGKWEPEGKGLRIHGTKNKYRDRIVPLVEPIMYPACTLDQLIWWLDKVGLTPYDGRRTFSRLCADAGITEYRISLYMGHSAKTQTRHYLRGDITSYLIPDRDRLRGHLGLAKSARRHG